MRPDRPLWRRTPPAIFPVTLGVMGLGLGWRNAGDVLPIAHEIGDVMLGFSMAFYLYFLFFFLRKLTARPGVIFEDMQSPPARAGVAAGAMSMMLLAAAFLPFGVTASEVWWAGVVLQIGASSVGAYAIWKDSPGEREFTPFQYLTFVGPVVAPIAGVPLGHVVASTWLSVVALIAYVVITAGYGRQLLRRRPAFPLRPTLVIFLAPNCLFALSFGLLGHDFLFWAFYLLADAVALVLLGLSPWLTAGGWTPIWSSFTFPLAAFLNMQVLAVAKGAGIFAVVGTYATLALATPVIFYVVYRSVMDWVTGALAEKTRSATA